MSTDIRPELSKNNPYFIPKHRYYELKHFCLQYPYWRRQRTLLRGYLRSPTLAEKVNNSFVSDSTADIAEEMARYSKLIGIIERAAAKTDETLGSYILRAVTEGFSYETMRSKYSIPCGRDVYYEMYRKFFHILDNERD